MEPYVRQILVQKLGMHGKDCLPRRGLGVDPPDPNRTYAAEMIKEMKKGALDLGAAFDGDGVQMISVVNSCHAVVFLFLFFL